VDSGDIVVTAQRREERLSSIPISVTALSGDQLQSSGISSTQDLTLTVPGLLWGRSTNNNQPTIRGVGSRNASPGDEPNVASFLDGVYLPDMQGTLFELSNIERIEVLKGPQTTLYGRNATGGAINLITRSPSWEFQGGASASYGEFDYYKIGGYIAGPLVPDVLAANLSAVHYGDDGYVRNIYTGEMQGKMGGTAVRGRLLLQATPRLDFQVNGLYARSHNNVLLSVYALNGNTQARNSIPGGPTAAILNPTSIPADQIIADEPYTTATLRAPTGRSRQKLGDIRFNWDLDFATLSGYASLASNRLVNENWTDASPLQLNKTEYTALNRARNQELVLTSRADPDFNWIVGIQGFQANARYDPLASTSRSAVSGAFSTSSRTIGQNNRAFAAFGEATWQPIQDFYLSGGVRFNRDSVYAFNTTAGVTVENRVTYNDLSPRASVRYEFLPDSNIYVSYAQGFKSGTFNPAVAAGVAVPAGPEEIDAFEAGIKARLFPGVRVEVAAFRYKYRDLQVSSAVIVNGVSTSTVQNAGRAVINGLEGSLVAQLTPQLQLNASMSLLDTKLQDFPNASVQIPRVDLSGNPTLNGNLGVIQDVSGNKLIRAPGHTFTVGATYTVPLFDGELSINGNAFFSSRYFLELTNRVAQPAYEVVNASVTWRAQPERGFYISVFGQNLTNQLYTAGSLVTGFIDGTQASKPRWFGGTIGFDF
jgi:iron complex outermembrane receptor protein